MAGPKDIHIFRRYNLKSTTKQFFRVILSIILPLVVYEYFGCSTVLSIFGIFYFILAILVDVQWYGILVCISLMTNNAEHLFPTSVGHLDVTFFEESFAPILIMNQLFYIIDLQELYIFFIGYASVIRNIYCKYLPLLCWSPFCSLICVFSQTKVLNTIYHHFPFYYNFLCITLKLFAYSMGLSLYFVFKIKFLKVQIHLYKS